MLQLVAVKSWQRSFLSMLFLSEKKKKKKKNKARKRQWQMAINRWDLATKKWEPKHHDVLYSKHFEKNASQIAPCWAFSLGSNTCPQGNRLGNVSSSNLQGWSSDAIASSWAFVYFPLVISSFLSLVRCVAFRSFSLCVLELSQQARPHQGACLLLGVLLYFPNLSGFVSSYVKMKTFCSF